MESCFNIWVTHTLVKIGWAMSIVSSTYVGLDFTNYKTYFESSIFGVLVVYSKTLQWNTRSLIPFCEKTKQTHNFRALKSQFKNWFLIFRGRYLINGSIKFSFVTWVRLLRTTRSKPWLEMRIKRNKPKSTINDL